MSVLQKKHPLKTLNGNRLLAAYGSLSLRPNTGKRKSAVEMLQETKAFYVKSERVLDAKQEMKHADHLQVSPTPLGRPPWPPRQYSEPPATPPPPPPPPRPAALPPRVTPEKPPWKTPEKPARTTPDKPPPLPARSPGCGGPCRATRLAREPAAPERRRSGDSVQARLRLLLTPAGRPPADGGRHKSLPDMSADSSSAATSADSGGMSEAGRLSRSEARSRRRATSDYVSRSPGSALTPSDGRRDALTDDGRALAGEPWPHRPVTRSKSDVSHKYGRGASGGGALGLWTAETPPPLPARGARRGSAELGRFFDQLGMDGERFGRVARVPSDHWSPLETPSFWDGLSGSSRSRGRRASVASEASSVGTGRRATLLPPPAAEPSIVEKNARIVKWLFHCRRAQEEWTLGVT